MSCGGQGNSATQDASQTSQEAVETPKSETPSAQTPSPSDQLVQQQDDDSPKTLEDEPLPAEVVKEAYTVPKELKYYKESDSYIFEKFYPIGWSKDGHFAYVVEPADEAAGLYFFQLVIRNMISDKDVYVWKPEDEMESGSVRQVWKDNQMSFAAKLNEYKIVPDNNIKLLGTEFNTANNKYKVTIENKMETEPDFGFEVVKTTNIFIKSPELGVKQIFSYTENDANICLGRIVQGVIKSPFEERVAVLVRTEECGYEGPPNVIKTFLVGSDLERSFKK
ncbi:MAG: hypothetical protein MJZ61_01675 [Bacteroidales bacterium]|nr:hypothetical protein [Bacteroidales bacterium]